MISGTSSGHSTAISPTPSTAPLPHEESNSIKTSQVVRDLFKGVEISLKEQLKSDKKQGKIQFALGTLFLVITGVTLVTIPFFLNLINKGFEKIDKYEKFKSDLKNLRDLEKTIDTRLTIISASIIILGKDSNNSQELIKLSIKNLKYYFSFRNKNDEFIKPKDSIINKQIELDGKDLIEYFNEMKTKLNHQLRSCKDSSTYTKKFLKDLTDDLKTYKEKLEDYQTIFIERAPHILLSQHQKNSITPSDKMV